MENEEDKPRLKKAKHVNWGGTEVHEIPRIVPKKEYIRHKLESLTLANIDELLEQNDENSQELYCKEGITAILELANEYAQYPGNYHSYDSEAFKNILDKLKVDYYETIKNIFSGLRIHFIIKKKTDFSPQVFRDYTDIMASKSVRANKAAISSGLSMSDNETHPQSSDNQNTNFSEKENSLDNKKESTSCDQSHTNQRVILPNTADNDKNYYCSSSSDALSKEVIPDNENSNVIINYIDMIFKWLNIFPQWLQEEKLNSTPISISLEETLTAASIYDSKYIQKHMVNMFTSLEVDNLDDITSDKKNEKATVIDSFSSNTEELIDKNMILQNPQVVDFLILPAVESSSILPDNGFMGLINFHGLNAIEIF